MSMYRCDKHGGYGFMANCEICQVETMLADKDKRIAELEKQMDDIKECELCDSELHGTGVCLSCWNTLGAKNASLIEENRSGTNALKLSGQALSKALDDVEKLLVKNKRLVETIKRGQY